MKTLFIDAGHNLIDPGATSKFGKESEEARKIRDKLAELLRKNGLYSIHLVPDELNLRQSIDWVNSRLERAGQNLALAIHLNFSTNPSVSGTEIFYGFQEDAPIAAVFAHTLSEELGTKNRGARPDTQSHVGRLGWIRDINCRSILIEVCYLSSEHDMKILHAPSGYEKAARGILKAINEIFNQNNESSKPVNENKKTQIKILLTLIKLYTALIELLKKKGRKKLKNKKP